MELMNDGDLRSFLDKTPKDKISWLDRLEFAIEIACGMEFLHSQGVVHCDLKSPNILLNKHNTCKIADF